MAYYIIIQIFIGVILVFTCTSGRSVYYKELSNIDNAKSISSEDDSNADDSNLILTEILSDEYNNNKAEDDKYDSYEERKFHERSLFSTSRPAHSLSAQTRQALMDILQKAVDRGWTPALKHYVPSTRFGRHRR
ncbi:hypothetical protein I4U23_007193 [Adineta vaga]|nr:hypothetical protein I4U23_007193 [Adineta vaga]